jgi:hypothetical protein
MKCPRCWSLNAPTDFACIGCGTPLAPYRQQTATPQWAYLFAVACGIIPIITLGGAFPAVIGFGGAGGCLSISRVSSLPVALRVLVCLVITVACWGLLALLLMEIMRMRTARR